MMNLPEHAENKRFANKCAPKALVAFPDFEKDVAEIFRQVIPEGISYKELLESHGWWNLVQFLEDLQHGIYIVVAPPVTVVINDRGELLDRTFCHVLEIHHIHLENVMKNKDVSVHYLTTVLIKKRFQTHKIHRYTFPRRKHTHTLTNTNTDTIY